MDLRKNRIWITGANGFLGKHLVAKLQAAGCQDLMAPTHQELDLLRTEDVREFLAINRPSVVIHLAAVVGGIGANKENPGRYFYENLMMGVPLMHEAYEAGVQKFVAIGTICAYPKHCPTPFCEGHLWAGYPEETNAPYGLAKKMLLVQAQAYREQYGFNAIYLLPVNLYGPGDNFDLHSSHVIPAMIRKYVEAHETGQESVTLWGDGSPTREFLYVKDAADGIIQATQRYDGSDPINLGTGSDIAIKNLARLISTMVGYEGATIWDRSRPNGQPRRCLDVSNAEKQFGFTAQTPFEIGLVETIRWYRENRLSIAGSQGFDGI